MTDSGSIGFNIAVCHSPLFCKMTLTLYLLSCPWKNNLECDFFQGFQFSICHSFVIEEQKLHYLLHEDKWGFCSVRKLKQILPLNL